MLLLFMNPRIPAIQLHLGQLISSINGPTTKTTDLIIGEQFVGQISGAIGLYTERLTDSEITFVPENETKFQRRGTNNF